MEVGGRMCVFFGGGGRGRQAATRHDVQLVCPNPATWLLYLHPFKRKRLIFCSAPLDTHIPQVMSRELYDWLVREKIADGERAAAAWAPARPLCIRPSELPPWCALQSPFPDVRLPLSLGWSPTQAR